MEVTEFFGNEGRDVLRGKAGNDRIEGEKGNDRLHMIEEMTY
jgi:Ca2+-binding RTX toxin-like protein